MLELYIYDKFLKCKGVIDFSQSIIWNRKLCAPDVVEINLPLKQLSLDLIQQYFTIVRSDTMEAVLIKRVTIIDDATEGKKINATAYDYTTMLYKRAFSVAGATVYDTINNNTQGNRAIPNMTLHNDLKNITITKQHEMLGDSLELAAQAQKTWGIKSILDGNTIKLVPINCVDRTAGQQENPKAIFAQKYDNFINMTYTISDENSVNTVICTINAEQAEDPYNAPVYSVESNISGFARCETHVEVDASIRHETEVISLGDSGSFTLDHSYVDVAKTYENATSACSNRIQSGEPEIEGEIFPIGYRTAWDLGDKVSIISQVGIEIETQITEVIEYYDFTNNKIVPTFGNKKLKIIDMLRKNGVL